MKEAEPYEQTERFSCGPSSLFICYRSFGLDITEQEIINSTGATDEQGSDWEDLERDAKGRGFTATMHNNGSYGSLMLSMAGDTQVIVGWWSTRQVGADFAHYSVVRRITPEDITLMDTSFGDEFTMTRQAFEHSWRDEETEHGFLVLYENKPNI